MFSLRNYIDIVEGNATLSEQPVANPYTGADAEKFARLSPEDQAWYTKGGGKPDLNDPYIAARAPNKGKLGAAPAAAPAAPAGGSPITTAPAGAAQTAAASGGAAAATRSLTNTPPPAGAAQPAPAAGGAAAAMATPSQKVDPNQADRDDAELGAAMKANAANAGAGGVSQAATPAPAGAAQPAPGAVAAFGANPATGVNAQGQNVTINNPDGSTTNPETGATSPAQAATPAPAAAPAAAPANRDAMPFGKAFADARAKGEKEFTWKGKKYAVKMAAPKQAATPKPAAAPLPGKAVPGGGQISDTPAAESVQMNEFDMDMDRIMKNMGNTNKTSSFTSNIDGKQDNTKAGFDTAMGKFNDITKDMNLPGGAKIDPTNIQSSVDSIKKGIMGQMSDMTKDITGNTPSSAPGANVPNPPTAEKQDPKDLLKKMPEADIEKLSGDDAKVLLGQLKKLAGM